MIRIGVPILCIACLYVNIEQCVFYVYADDIIQTISGRVDRASATETVDSGSISSRVKPKTTKIGIHSFPA